VDLPLPPKMGVGFGCIGRKERCPLCTCCPWCKENCLRCPCVPDGVVVIPLHGFSFDLEWTDEFLAEHQTLSTSFKQGGKRAPMQMLRFQTQHPPTLLEMSANNQANEKLQMWLSHYMSLRELYSSSSKLELPLQLLQKSVNVVTNGLDEEPCWEYSIVSHMSTYTAHGVELQRMSTRHQSLPQSQGLQIPAREDFPLKMVWVPPIELLPAFIEIAANSKGAGIDSFSKFKASVPLVQATFKTVGEEFLMKVGAPDDWPQPENFPVQLEVQFWRKTLAEVVEDGEDKQLFGADSPSGSPHRKNSTPSTRSVSSGIL